jgi:Arc/MetJ family transcription regulator
MMLTIVHVWDMKMRTTIALDDKLMAEAAEYTGITEKTALLHAGLKSLIAREAGRRLAAMGGSDPQATAAPRRRSKLK